ncbi:hypothetical protein LKO31_13345 [Sphingopyxis sp. FBM22]|nr:hypothetical protein [Sphingopyxis yananensis]
MSEMLLYHFWGLYRSLVWYLWIVGTALLGCSGIEPLYQDMDRIIATIESPRAAFRFENHNNHVIREDVFVILCRRFTDASSKNILWHVLS